MTKACAGTKWTRTPTSRRSNGGRTEEAVAIMAVVLKGAMQSPVTPLKEDFSPAYATFERLVAFHVRAGATAISWPHHKAEPHNLAITERKALAEVAIKAVNKRVP